MSKPLIAFCMIHLNRVECTRRCISSIFETTSVPFKILLLVQGYEHGIDELELFTGLVKQHHNIEIYFSSENVGPVAGRKFLFERANAPFIGSLDNDTYLRSGWLQPMLDLFEQDDELVALSSPLYNKDGSLFSSGGGVVELDGGKFKNDLVDMSLGDFARADVFNLACALIRREAKEFIKFDPNYKINFGGLDMLLTFNNLITEVGLKSGVALKSGAEHWQIGNPTYKAIRMNYPEIAKSYSRFRKKWGVRVQSRKEHVKIKYLFPLLRRPVAQFLRWLKRKPPLIWIMKPKVI